MASAFRAIFFSFILLSSFAAHVVAGPLEGADAAWERRDFATALPLLRPLADQGNADAQMKLGFMYVTGEGIPQNYVEAVKWFHLAADQGQANAQCFLGLIYFEGHGVPQDYVSAYMWLSLAAAGGIEDAAEYRHALTAKMTPTQVAEAQRLAREWKPDQK
jgi:TPR repeat protein